MALLLDSVCLTPRNWHSPAFPPQKKNGLTEPEETNSAYQYHFFLILCENLPIPAMVCDDASQALQVSKIGAHTQEMKRALQDHQRTNG